MFDDDKVSRAKSALRAIPPGGSPTLIFEALRGCTPEVEAGMLSSVFPSQLGAMASHLYRVPPPILESWMGTDALDMTRALGVLFRSAEGSLWRSSGLPARAREGLGVLHKLDDHGLGEGAGYKIMQRAHPQLGQEHCMLVLLTARGTVISESSSRALHALNNPLQEAVNLTKLPLIASKPILDQLLAEQSMGYICLSTSGRVIETNQRAHSLLLRHMRALGLSSFRGLVEDFVEAMKRRARGPFIMIEGEGARLEVHVHQLSKDSAALPEDMILLTVREQLHGLGSSQAIGALSKRQKEISRLLASTGLSYKEIADKIGLSEGTVRKHVEKLYRKIQVNSRYELIQKMGTSSS